MSLPKEISPNPLVTTVVEVRFVSNISSEEVLGTFYPVFSKIFPKLKDTVIPKELKQNNKDLRYTPDYILSNDLYTFSIGANVIAFENIDKYTLWPNYFAVIKENLELLKGLNVIKNIERVGLRYASIFNLKKAHEVFKVRPGIQYRDFESEVQLMRTELKKDGIVLLLQVSEKAQVKKNNVHREGVYIDIDSYSNKNVPSQIDENLFKLIDRLHKEEKELFFSLLRDEFIKTLNPKF